MNVTDYSSTDVVSAVSSVPRFLWNFYLDNLVFYSSNSWVSTFAYMFRVIAIILFLPLLALTLLDLVPYGVARTLGIIDQDRTSHNKVPVSSKTSALPSLDSSDPHAFFAGEESNVNLASGHDLSPMVSPVASPSLSRHALHPESTLIEGEEKAGPDGLRKRQTANANV